MKPKDMAILEIIPMYDGWWYDLRASGNSITPERSLRTRSQAIQHARSTARRFHIRITAIENMADKSGKAA